MKLIAATVITAVVFVAATCGLALAGTGQPALSASGARPALSWHVTGNVGCGTAAQPGRGPARPRPQD